ncbi:putative ABC transporter [Diplocarpon rosae]|nr:putative ABC transporter [Diplocarpon rosae]
MDTLLLGWMLTLASIAAVYMVVFIGQYWSQSPSRISRVLRPGKGTSSLNLAGATTKTKAKGEKLPGQCDEAEKEELEAIKHLYYQLHSLEEYPHVLPQAKRLLLSLLKETGARVETSEESILSIPTFSRQALYAFQGRLNQKIGDNWQHYNQRRREGGQRELFEDREEATWWLKQISPVKYVDGAWLGHIGKVTAPFALQKTMKGAWQILSEELGDGDLDKNHVHLFHKLLETVAPAFPTAEELDFGHPRHQLDELSVWKAAIAQLLISLFPHEFLPEILGFNLHFEAVSMDTLKAARELKEVGLDPYYFILHVSIDNADSGHTAIAIEVVCEYMDCVRRMEGEEAAQNAWKKVQAGFLLSLGLPGSVICPSRRKSTDDANVLLSSIETDVMKIFTAKAQVVHGIHCSSRVKIGSRSVAEWLDPIALESKIWQMGLLDALGRSKYWICRGDSSKSRFLQELQWNGRMFGSFTQSEFNILKKWVDGLSNMSLTWKSPDSESEIQGNDILSGHPAFHPRPSFRECPLSLPSHGSPISYQNLPPLDIGNRPVFESFLPIWLSHPCLLQGFVSVPFRTKSKLVCAIVKILRAQGGFDIEQECVGGMCEVRRPNSLGLAGIGMNMMAQHGPSVAALPSLKHVLQAWPSDFSVHMLHISMRPMAYKGQLIGMSTAFAKMHVVMAECQLPLLSAQDQVTLQAISKRELEGLEACWNEIEKDGEVYAECCKGYRIAEQEIKKCFRF